MPASPTHAVNTDLTQHFNAHAYRPPTQGNCGDHKFKHDAGNKRVPHLTQVWPKPGSVANAWSSQPGGPARASNMDAGPGRFTARPTYLDLVDPEDFSACADDSESSNTDIGKFANKSASNVVADDEKPSPLPRVKSLRRPKQHVEPATSRQELPSANRSASSPGTSRDSAPSMPAADGPETPPKDPDQACAIDKAGNDATAIDATRIDVTKTATTGVDETLLQSFRHSPIDDRPFVAMNPAYAPGGHPATDIAEDGVHGAFANVHPYGSLFTAAEPRLAELHPDVVNAHTSLRLKLSNAAPKETRSMRKAAQPTGSKLLRRLMMFMRRQHDQPLHAHSMAFYKHLAWHAAGASTSKQVSASLAALAQRAAAEGYDAVAEQLVGQTLNPQLHSLSTETLAYLASLKHRDNKTRDEILSKVDKLLGVKKGRRTGKAEQAGKQAEVAAALLDLVAELCDEHFRIKTWDRPMASFLSAVDQGQYEQMDEALRKIWRGDLRMGDMKRAREDRLHVGRLGEDQAYKLASALGLMGTTKESTTFDTFENEYLPKYEPNKAIRDQLIKLLTHLRVQARKVLQEDPAGQRPLSTSFTPIEDAFQAASYPAARQPTIGQRIRSKLRKSFRTPAAQVNAERQIKQTALALVNGNPPTEEQLKALTSAYRKLDQALGQTGAASLLGRLVQDRASKMDEKALTQLDFHLENAIKALPDEDELEYFLASEQEDARTRRRFYEDLRRAQRKEPGIRSASAALKQVLDALPDNRHPEKLLDALDSLAAASCRILDGQDEQDFYKNAFLRLDSKKRKALRDYLNGRHGIERYARAVGKVMVIAPKAWSDFRRHQLAMLANAAAATA